MEEGRRRIFQMEKEKRVARIHWAGVLIMGPPFLDARRRMKTKKVFCILWTTLIFTMYCFFGSNEGKY